jgi:hypothetical protein
MQDYDAKAASYNASSRAGTKGFRCLFVSQEQFDSQGLFLYAHGQLLSACTYVMLVRWAADILCKDYGVAATVHLLVRVPSGFHGLFVPQEQLDSQGIFLYAHGQLLFACAYVMRRLCAADIRRTDHGVTATCNGASSGASAKWLPWPLRASRAA